METTDILELLLEYGYLIIILWTFLEGETVVIIAGFLSNQGSVPFSPWLISLCAFIGSFCSDQLMFALGKHKGSAILKRFPKAARNTHKARKLMLKYETALILGFRFIYGIRNVTPILLGISGVKHSKFFILNFIGAVIWAFSFSFGGYYFGSFYTYLSETYPHAGILFLAVIITTVVAIFLILRRRRKAGAVERALSDHFAVEELHSQNSIKRNEQKTRKKNQQKTRKKNKQKALQLDALPNDLVADLSNNQEAPTSTAKSMVSTASETPPNGAKEEPKTENAE